MKKLKQLLIFILALALTLSVSVLPAAAANSAKATTLRLAKTSGSVTVENSSGKGQSIKTDMRLYSGYTVATGKSSDAYISLDGTKAVKLDASSKGSVKKSGSKLEVCLDSGKLFFDVTVPLAANESLNIRTSTMVTGIRGSFGWVTDTEVGLMHGHVTLTCINPVTGETRVTELYSGQRVYYGPGASVPSDPNLKEIDFIKEIITNKDVPAFVVEEMRNDKSLQTPVIEDVPSVDVPKLLEDYDAIKAAEDAVISEKESELAEKRAEQNAAIDSDRSNYLFNEESHSSSSSSSSSSSDPHSSSFSVFLPSVPGLVITSSDPVSGIEPGMEFHFNISPDSGYALYEEYLIAAANGSSLSLTDDGADGYDASFIVDSDTSVTASGAVYLASTFADAISAFNSGVDYAELIAMDTPTATTPGATVASGKTLIVGSDTETVIGDVLTNDGAIVVNGLLRETGGSLYNNGTIDINGSLFVSGGHLYNYGTITNREALEIESGGTFHNYSGNTLVNEASLLITGTFENGDGEMYAGRLVNNGFVYITESGEFNNNFTGTIATGTESEFICTGVFNNDGNVTNSGSMELNNFEVAEGASFINNGMLITTSSFMNNGTFTNSGTVDINYTFQNNSLCTNTGVIDNTNGAIYNGSSSMPATLNNNGEIKMLSTTQGAIFNNGTFNNNVGGSITGYGHIYNYAVFNNYGTVSARGFDTIGEDGGLTGNPPTLIATYTFSFVSSITLGENYMLFSDQTVADGQTAAEPAEAPLGDGAHTFEGWYQEADCVNKFDFGTPITQRTFVYAKWLDAAP